MEDRKVWVNGKMEDTKYSLTSYYHPHYTPSAVSFINKRFQSKKKLVMKQFNKEFFFNKTKKLSCRNQSIKKFLNL